MISLRKIWIVGILGIFIAAGLQSCSTQTIAMKPATIIHRDVFVCKGLSNDNKWVGITDQFLPDQDSQVVVVAFLDKQDSQKVVQFELVNPVDNVATSETLIYPKENPIGIYFSIPRLLTLGGEGQWTATVFADGEAIGESKFTIGEKSKEEEKKEGSTYFVVGDDNQEENSDSSLNELSDEERFSSYIREVTPNLTIPFPEEIEPATDSVNPSP